MNIITISGRLHKEVRVQHFDNFSVLSGTASEYGNSRYFKDDELVDGSIFYNFKLKGSEKQINYFEDSAEPGRNIVLIGELKEEQYKDKETKEVKTSRYINVIRFDFPTSKDELAGAPAAGKVNKKAVLDDDPFAS